MKMTKRHIAAASDGKQAVALMVVGGQPLLWKYAPRAAGDYNNRDAFYSLIDRAAGKLGYKRDLRCKSQWRQVKELST